MQRAPYIITGNGVSVGLYVDRPREVLGNQANVGSLGDRCVCVPIGVIGRVWDSGLGRWLETDIHTCQGCVRSEDRVETGVFPSFRSETIGCWEVGVRTREAGAAFH